MTKAPDITGQRFGSLTIVARAENAKAGTGVAARWACRCDCGAQTTVLGYLLRTGKTKSCGCRRVDAQKKHGHATRERRTATYETWAGMIQRCDNPSVKSYSDYGSRGIKVCDRWRVFENFLADMGEKPRRLTIDRIDNGGDYEPSNCRWATRDEQGRNKRNNRLVEFRGKRIPLAEAVAVSGLKRLTVHQRIKRGWSVERALSTPARPLAPQASLCRP